jgi:glycosyltransferase involved in cell wall biosynthesis
VLLPTTYEGCAFTVLEALASGRPVITTRTGWTRDLATRLPEYRPLLVAPRVNDVARAIIDLDAIATPPLLEAARSLVIAGNSLERFVAQWHDLCIEVIGNRSVAVAMSQ